MIHLKVYIADDGTYRFACVAHTLAEAATRIPFSARRIKRCYDIETIGVILSDTNRIWKQRIGEYASPWLFDEIVEVLR